MAALGASEALEASTEVQNRQRRVCWKWENKRGSRCERRSGMLWLYGEG